MKLMLFTFVSYFVIIVAFVVPYTSAFISNNSKLYGEMSWFSIPPHVQKSGSRFSCFCAFLPALPPERALRLSCFRAVVSHALSEGLCDRNTCVAEIIRTSTETRDSERSF